MTATVDKDNDDNGNWFARARPPIFPSLSGGDNDHDDDNNSTCFARARPPICRHHRQLPNLEMSGGHQRAKKSNHSCRVCGDDEQKAESRGREKSEAVEREGTKKKVDYVLTIEQQRTGMTHLSLKRPYSL
jgi:hypothetical protein